MPRKLTHHHYEQLARERQFGWLGEEVPKNTQEKTTWRCAKGHRWEAPYCCIKHNGTGCPHCAGLARKKAEDYHALARQRGFKWLGPSVKNTQTKTQWQCSDNHTWFATYNSIYLRSHCPICDPRDPLSEADYHVLAKQRGFEWLGPMVENAKTKTEWRCGKGHTWLAIYSSIRQGSGCPTCARSRFKTEADYRALAEQRDFDWLGPMPKNVNTKSEWRCAKNHTWLATYSGIQLRGKCPICAKCAKIDNQPKTEADYHAVAKLRGFVWLGPPVKNSKTRTQWRCSKGHTWFTTYNSIQQGSKCGEC